MLFKSGKLDIGTSGIFSSMIVSSSPVEPESPKKSFNNVRKGFLPLVDVRTIITGKPSSLDPPPPPRNGNPLSGSL